MAIIKKDPSSTQTVKVWFKSFITHKSILWFLCVVVVYSLADCIFVFDPTGLKNYGKYANNVYGAITAFALLVSIEIYKESKSISSLVLDAKKKKMFEVKDLLDIQSLLKESVSIVEKHLISDKLNTESALNLKKKLLTLKILFTSNLAIILEKYEDQATKNSLSTHFDFVRDTSDNLETLLLEDIAIKNLYTRLCELEILLNNYRNLE